MSVPASSSSRIGRRVAVATFVSLSSLMLAHPGSGQQAPEAAPPEPSAFEIAPRGYVQLDWRGYPDWTVSPGTGRLEHNTVEVRRLRAGLDGQWRRLAFEITLDPQDLDGTLVKDAYAQFRFSGSVRIRAGRFKLPGSREYQTSARALTFMERSALASSIAAGRDLGAMLTGRLGRAEYEAGIFAGDGNGRTSRADLTSAGRILWNADSNFEIGTSFSVGKTSSLDSDPANGLDGRSSSGYRFFERVYVQGRRVRLGADVRWEPGRWRLESEVLRAHDERSRQGLDLEDLPSLEGLGWSIAIVRKFGRGKGIPRLREWDLGLRLDDLSFDDDGPETQADSVRPRATDVRASRARTLTAAASWSPMRWTRVVTEAALERFSEPRSAPEAGRRDPYWTFGLRLQFELP
jgi:hypothetical protein